MIKKKKEKEKKEQKKNKEMMMVMKIKKITGILSRNVVFVRLWNEMFKGVA